MEQNKKGYLYVIGILIILLIGMYFWKTLAVRSVEKKVEAQKAQIVEKSRQVITDKTKYFLRLTATPFIWAIRKEMLRENYEQINEYLVQFVKEPHIKQVLIARSDGTIIVATDKKLEGTALSSLHPQQLIGADEIVLSDDKSGNILVVAPVMGFNKKLGVFLMVYEPEKINFDVSQ